MARKVLFVQSQSEMGGAEHCLLTLCEHLDRGALVPEVALLGFGEGPLAERLGRLGVAVHQLERARLRNLLGVRRVRRELAGIAGASGAQVTVANGYHPHVYAAPAARRAKTRSVLFAHDFPARGFSVDALIARWAQSLGAQMVLAPSTAVARAVARRTRGARVEVVPNGVDPAALGGGDRAAARRRLGLEEPHVAFVLAGRLQPGKGQRVFLRAAALARPEVPQAVFVVAGEALFGRGAAYAAELPRLARELGVEEHVRFPGHVPAPDLFAAADVVVLASTEGEGFGRVLIEGMAARRPVVATRVGGPEEVVSDGETGLLVPPGDADALARAMVRLGRDAGLRARMAAAGRARVEAAFTAERSAVRFAEAVGSLWEGARG